MAKTLEELRADLGRFIGMFHTGTVDAIADEIIVDGDGLAHITENDALNAGLAYIRTAVGSAEGESAWIEDYVPPEPSDATELLSNGGFETAGGGGADVFGSWTEVAGDGAIAQDAAIYLFGAKSCKLTSGVLKNTKVYQDIVVVPSTPYRVEIFCYTASTKKASASVIDTGATETFWIESDLATSATGVHFTKYEGFFVTPEYCTAVRLQLGCIQENAEIIYYDGISIEKCGGIYLSEKLSHTLEEDDVYEVYKAPLTLAQWDQTVNDAINAAWPQVFSRELWETPASGVAEYSLPDDARDVLEVAVAFRDQYLGYPTESLPRQTWRIEGTPGTDLQLHLHRIVPSTGRDLNVYYKGKYAELAAGESTDLDPEYLMLAGAARLYHILAAEAGTQAASGRYLQLFNYYDEQSQERRDLLEVRLLGLPVAPETRRERR